MFNELVDVKENKLINIDYELLTILLYDQSSKKNIIWATDNYCKNGSGFQYNDEIQIDKITGLYGNVIQPRTKKTKEEKIERIKKKGEVFTPSWMCNAQNNIIDRQWFEDKDVFNVELDKGWVTKNIKIDFDLIGKSWKEYVLNNRLEISCGEAPYIVSRYDTVTGKTIALTDRIGLLDRKFRVINENCSSDEWIEWSVKAMKSVYGYDWQGDNVLLARENLLYTYIDYYRNRFNEKPSLSLIKEIALIISWNIWQMDGMNFIIPNSCKNEEYIENTIFGENVVSIKCEGCDSTNIKKHNGIYCNIMDWQKNKSRKFISLIKGGIK